MLHWFADISFLVCVRSVFLLMEAELVELTPTSFDFSGHLHREQMLILYDLLRNQNLTKQIALYCLTVCAGDCLASEELL